MNSGPREYITEPGGLADIAMPALFKPIGRPAGAPPRPVAHGIEAQVCFDIALRQAHGVSKYGTTVAANPLELRAWLQHAYEELLDGAVYLRRAMAEIDAATPIQPEKTAPGEHDAA